MSAGAVTTGAAPGADVLIRIAAADEVTAIGALGRAAYADSYRVSTDYLEEIEDSESRATGAELWVAVDAVSDELLGTITLPAAGERLQDDTAEDEMDIRLLAVTPAARGRGIGERLMHHSAQVARERGARRIVLHTASFMHGAQRLYERLGYERIPEREFEFEEFGEKRAVWAYGLDLAA